MQLYTHLLRESGEAVHPDAGGPARSPAPSPQSVLRRLAARARRRGLAPPAALTGDWFGGSAVLAPTVAVRPVPAEQAFSTLDDLPPVAVEDGAVQDGAAEDGAVEDGPVGGGWIGYLGYGLADPRPRERPEAAWGWADHVLRLDPAGRWWFEALRAERPPAELVQELAAVVAGGEEPAGSGNPPRSWRAGPVAEPDADRHRKAVRRCGDEIAAGEIFQANICSRFAVPFSGDPLEVFAAGGERFRPARAAYVAGGWGAVASLSPELFLARRGRVVRSNPIKGTLPRRGPEDDHNAQLLRESTKDSAENVMIVDMVRNDLGRVAEAGTVQVERLLDVQPHPGVWHLVSDVRAEVDAELPNSALLDATFPPASVTGTPKVRALEVIEELEQEPRDVYCGAVGMASPVAGVELNVAIRTLEHDGDELRFGVGGGITADSDPEAEWHECLTKAAPLRTLLDAD